MGVFYSTNITANGGTLPYSFTNTVGSLPTGYTLNSSGLLSGTPLAADTANFTITATDANGCMGSQPYTIIVNPPPTHTLSVASVNPSSGVLIGVAPADNNGISATNTPFNLVYNDGTVVTVQASATAPNGNLFQKWLLDGAMYSTSSGTSVVMNADYTVTAVYTNTPAPPVASFTGSPTNGPAPLMVTFNNLSTGSITNQLWSFGDGGTSSALNPTHTYNAGSFTVSLTVFGPGGSNTKTNSNFISVTSTNIGTVILTVTKAGLGTGTVTSSPSGIDCGATCSANFSSNTVVTLTATANASSTFTGWSGGCSGTGPCNVTMDAAKTVTAGFNPCSYAISPTSQSFTSGGAGGSVSVTTQAGCAWTATSNAGWITIQSGGNGTGNGTINYFVAANNSGSQRVGTMTIAGHTFTVTQAAGVRPVVILPGNGGSYLCSDSIPCDLAGWPFDILTGLGNPGNLQFTQTGQPTIGISTDLRATAFLTPPAYQLESLVEFLESNGYQINMTLWELPYDWRRSVTELGQSLVQRIEAIRAATGADKVDIVAHSMGGLVAKQYLADPNNAAKVGTFVMLGTPNLGAPKALKALRYGDNLGLPLLIDACKLKRAAHNMPGVFNLLPGRRYFDILGGYFDDAADIDGDGRRGVLGFNDTTNNLVNGVEYFCPLQITDPAPVSALSSVLVRNQLTDFHAQLDVWQKPSGVKVYAIVGYGAPTIIRLGESIVLGIRRSWVDYSCLGDGTVPLLSAQAVPLDGVYFANLGSLGLNSSHMGMVGVSEIQSQILNLLRNSTAPGGTHISQTRPTTCLNYILLATFSPVQLSVFDSAGNHTGFLSDGSSEAKIPGSAADSIEHMEFVAVPAGDTYTASIVGLEQGMFALWQTDLDGSGRPLRRVV